MAIKPEELKDIANSINAAVKELDRFSKSTGEFEKNLENILLSSEQWIKKYRTTKDLLGAMTKDSKLLGKVYEKISASQAEHINKYYKVVERKLTGQKLSAKEILKLSTIYHRLEEKIKNTKVSVTSEMEHQLALAQRQADWQEESLGFFSSISSKFKEKFQSSTLGKMLSDPKAMLALGVWNLLGLAINFVVSAFKNYWKFLNDVVKQQAFFNREIGDAGAQTGILRKQMISTAVSFKSLGLSFEEGGQITRDLYKSFVTVGTADKDIGKVVKTGVKLIKVLGMTSEQASSLMNVFDRAGEPIEEVGKTMIDASAQAQKFGIPVREIQRAFAENIDLLARFGTKNRVIMTQAIVTAARYRVNIKEVNASFGKQMDTFDRTSDVAAKLNAVLGTNINSYRLLLETDPTQRMVMLSDELKSQGKSWDDLSVFEKNFLTTQLQVTDEFAALAFTQKDAAGALKNYEKQQRRQQKAESDWVRGLGRVKEVVTSIGAKWELLTVAFVNFLSKLLGFNSAAEPTMKVAKTLELFIDNLTKSLHDFKTDKPLFDLQNAIENFPKIVPKVIQMADSIKTLAEALNMMMKPVKWFHTLGESIGYLFSGYEGTVKENTIKSAISMLKSGASMEEILKDPDIREYKDEIMAIRNLTKAGGTPIRGAKDALITKNGQFIKFHPQDNIIATKNPVVRSASGATATAGTSRSTEDKIIIMPAPVIIDGTKIAEVLFSVAKK